MKRRPLAPHPPGERSCFVTDDSTSVGFLFSGEDDSVCQRGAEQNSEGLAWRQTPTESVCLWPLSVCLSLSISFFLAACHQNRSAVCQCLRDRERESRRVESNLARGVMVCVWWRGRFRNREKRWWIRSVCSERLFRAAWQQYGNSQHCTVMRHIV